MYVYPALINKPNRLCRAESTVTCHEFIKFDKIVEIEAWAAGKKLQCVANFTD